MEENSPGVERRAAVQSEDSIGVQGGAFLEHRCPVFLAYLCSPRRLALCRCLTV